MLEHIINIIYNLHFHKYLYTFEIKNRKIKKKKMKMLFRNETFTRSLTLATFRTKESSR